MKRNGPAPQPAELKLLRGNPGKRPLPKHRVRPLLGAMPPPQLDRDALKEWQRLAPELDRLGLLAQIDRAALAAYCRAWSKFLWAVRTIRREGYITEAGNGTRIPHPAVAIEQAAIKSLRDLSAEFGFTPAARTRVIFEGPEADANDDSADFFGPRPAPAPRPPKPPA